MARREFDFNDDLCRGDATTPFAMPTPAIHEQEPRIEIFDERRESYIFGQLHDKNGA